MIYATQDKNNPDGSKSDVLELPDFHMKVDNGPGFVLTPPSVFVRRVTGTGGTSAVAPLLPGENVEFSVKTDAFYTAINDQWIDSGQTKAINATSLLSKTILETIITDSTQTGLTINTDGVLEHGGKVYRPHIDIKANSFENIVNTSTDEITDVGIITNIEGAFSAGKQISNVKVLARIK